MMLSRPWRDWHCEGEHSPPTVASPGLIDRHLSVRRNFICSRTIRLCVRRTDPRGPQPIKSRDNAFGDDVVTQKSTIRFAVFENPTLAPFGNDREPARSVLKASGYPLAIHAG